MKKVLVLAVVFALFAAPAFAGISGSKHDLSSASPGGELCVFCHTPHDSNTAVTKAPLWNRTTVDATAIYVGADIQASFDLASVNATDAPLCLSCHDGTSLTQTLQNEPNSGATTWGAGYTWGSTSAILDTNLSNDHPIGFDFSLLNAADAEIETISNAQAAGVQFFSNQMWCASCHDVHDNTNAPFLQVANTGSDLCLACHIK